MTGASKRSSAHPFCSGTGSTHSEQFNPLQNPTADDQGRSAEQKKQSMSNQTHLARSSGACFRPGLARPTDNCCAERAVAQDAFVVQDRRVSIHQDFSCQCVCCMSTKH
jgi:hypothetical protein